MADAPIPAPTPSEKPAIPSAENAASSIEPSVVADATFESPATDVAPDATPEATIEAQVADVATMAADVNAAAAGSFDADQAAIDELLKMASFESPPPEADREATPAMPGMESTHIDLPNFQQVMQEAQVSSIDLLRDVELNVKIELGRARMLVDDVLKLGEGSVVELDKLAGDPVDVFVNDRLVARGEVLVLNDSFCVRVNEIVAGVKEEGL